MKTLVAHRKCFALILTVLFTPFGLVGCGEIEEENNQPVIAAIPDRTLDVGDTLRMEVRVTDADSDDTHTIRAVSIDASVATTAVNGSTLSIRGMRDGMTTITVDATDDSGQENAAATPVSFRVSVKKNNQPVIAAISDQAVDVGDERAIAVNLTDADADDTHTIKAVSDNTSIATVSVNNATLTLTGRAGGMTTITVSATDDSGQDNAAAKPLTFKVIVDANSQPIIRSIFIRTLDVGERERVTVRITDADADDTHTIRASSNNRAIATVSVNNTTLTITGRGEGSTTITVSAEDNSGQKNAAAKPRTFTVTVRGNTVSRDPSFSDLLAIWANANLAENMFRRATKLRAGLEFPIDTFAVNEERTVLVAHTPEGRGLVLVGRARFEAGGSVNLGWLTFVKRGNLRVLTHYDP